MPSVTNVTSAKEPAGISLNLSALAEESIGLAISELETVTAKQAQSDDEADSAAESEQPRVLSPASDSSMQDYYQLQQNLLKLTLVFTVIAFLAVWGAYSLNTALSYVVGAITGIVYFRMLSKSVGQMGREKSKPSSARLAVFAGVMVASTQLQQLSVLPVFLGFLTYKAALIAFVIWIAVFPQQESAF